MSRGTGKTLALMHMSHNTGYHMVVINRDLARLTAKAAEHQQLIIPFPITFDEFINHKYHGKEIEGFLIDNAELLLEQMTNIKIKAISLTGDV